MSINITVNFSSDEPHEVEIAVDAYIISHLAKEIDDIDKRFGPDRSIGPVRFVLRDGEKPLITIGTQKQGDQAYYLDQYGAIVTGYPPFKETT